MTRHKKLGKGRRLFIASGLAGLLLTLEAFANENRAGVKTIEPDTDAIRLDYLRKSTLWTDVPTINLNLLQGPAPHRFSFNERVTCNYHTPGRKLGGATPKFLCEVDGVVYKVKYLPQRVPSANREIFAEVAATRLFWALGFGSDRSYPVQIVCRGCPADPTAGASQEERRARDYKTRARFLGTALIEERFEGATIESSSDQGWNWTELDQHVGTYGRGEVHGEARDAELAEIRKHVEALKLLQVFVQHGDCKKQQQRLVCLPDAITPTPASEDADADEDEKDEGVLTDVTGTSCRQSFAIVDDLGATFGGAGDMTKSSAKMDLKHWAKKDVFDMDHYEQSGGQCRGVLNVSSSCGGGIENPIITETGRRFLLERLSQLAETQIRDLFLAARVDQLDNDLERHDEGGSFAWLQVFQQKVRQIAAVRCSNP